MAGENRKIASAANIKALFKDGGFLKELRRRMGLGGTLGALEPQFGGVGSGSQIHVKNPQASYCFRFRKVVAENVGEPVNAGTVNGRYTLVLKTSSMQNIALAHYTDAGVKTEEQLDETHYQSYSETPDAQFAYGKDGMTYLVAKHGGSCVLYSWSKSGVKSVVYKETQDNTGCRVATDPSGAYVSMHGSSSAVNTSYRPRGGAVKKGRYGLQSNGSIYIAFSDGVLYCTSGQYSSNNKSPVTYDWIDLASETSGKEASTVAGNYAGIAAMRRGAFAYTEKTEDMYISEIGKSGQMYSTFAPTFGRSFRFSTQQYSQGRLANIDELSPITLFAGVGVIDESMTTVSAWCNSRGPQLGDPVLSRCGTGGVYFATPKHDKAGKRAIYSLTLETAE